MCTLGVMGMVGRAAVLDVLSVSSFIAGVVVTMFSMIYMSIPGIITGYALIAASLVLEITLKR